MSDAPHNARAGERIAVMVALAALVAGGAWLRFASLDHGLPLLRGRPDELEVIEATATFPAGDWNPRFFVYPNFLFYVVYAWAQLLLAIRRAWEGAPDYATLLQSGVPTLILYGRALMATAGTASIGIVFAIARRAAGTAVGLVAAALLAANFLHVRDSHALKPDVLLGILMLWSLWRLARWVDQPDRRRMVAAGIAVGLTMAIKYNGIFLLIPAYVEVVRGSSAAGWRRLVPSGSFVALAAVAAATFLAACPYLLIDFGRATFTSWFLAFTVFATRPQAALPAGASWLGVPLQFIRTRAFGYHVTMSLWHGFGALATLAVPFALVHAARRHDSRFFRMSVVFVACYYLVIGAAPVHLVRYFTALVPVLVVLIATWLVDLAAHVQPPARRAAIAAATLALVAQPVASGVAHDRIAGRTDTRVLAADWMRTHLPADAVVSVIGAGIFPYADPEVPAGIRRVPNLLPPGAYGREGVTHVVTHEHRIPFSRLDPSVMAKLAPHLRLLAEWSPFTAGPAGGFEDEDAFYIPFYDFAGVERPGPLVRTYAYEAVP